MLAALGKLSAGEDLSQDEMTSVMDVVMQGKASESEIALLLTAINAKGAAVTEVAGAAAALRRHMTPIHTTQSGCLDTCGTGGDASGTFNISTAAALVAAAAGVPVAKHGNRSISSKSGSADVLAALGVNIEASAAQVEACLNEVGIGFCFAPMLHPAMKHVSAVRKNLGVPTIFNLLGPLANPASAPFQLLGVGKPELRTLLARAVQLLGTERTVVVCGRDRFDEVSLQGPTDVTIIEADTARERVWTPQDFGLAESPHEALVVDGPESSAAMIQEILAGKEGPPRDVVVLNAAAAIWTAGRESSLTECARLAADSIDSGKARQALANLVEISRRG